MTDQQQRVKPKGIYANHYEDMPSFVRTKLKVHVPTFLAWLAEQRDPEVFLEVLISQKPDEYGNTDYITVDEYMTTKKRLQARAGIQEAKQTLAAEPAAEPQGNRPQTHEFPEDDIPF